MNINAKELENNIFKRWDETIVPTLKEYIRIPNMSPTFDPKWNTNGEQERAAELLVNWAKEQNVHDLQIDILKEEDRTPMIVLEKPATSADISGTVFLYGHFDKQPPFDGWKPDLGPWTPVYTDDGKLYGRGGADDGYALFSVVSSLKALQDQNVPHGRCICIIEGAEESGSRDLPFYMDQLRDRIGTPDLVVCLDSGCGNYHQLWATTSLRGSIAGTLRVEMLDQGVHSGDASGVVPDSFRVVNRLLSRIENSETGQIKLPELQTEISEERMQQVRDAAEILGETLKSKFPFVDSAYPVTDNAVEMVLNRAWRPMLSVTGADGLPPTSSAGNVLRPSTSVKLSMRIPPTIDPRKAATAIKETLENDPPYGARISFDVKVANPGWNAPPIADWLSKSLSHASETYYSQSMCYMGDGMSIPFMGMLAKQFPNAQFFVTGVLGPHSNAHGPNEFLHVPMAKKLTCCVAEVIAKHGEKN